SLVNSYNPLHIKSFSNRITETLQHTAQAKTPTDIEVKLSKTPQFNISFDSDRLPHGPSIELKQANTTANPKIPKAVEKAVADTSLKSAPAINTLYQKGLEESYLTRILSSGSLGIGKNRKFVPTRWAITATDDTLAKNLLKEVKHYPLADHLLYRGGGWGNHYYILFFPRLFSYELFETLVRTGNYSTDYESYKGRTTYAKETVGGYYAARLPIIDKLKKIQKQASVLVLRFITDDYWMPLGVWVCREATRKTLVNKPLHFSDPKQMISHITQEIQKKFKININQHLNQSKLLQSLTQRQLSDY
ncbi:hypothetical protein CMO92_04265, partial [Candidatus Woesearchaeota archaeon]|nr:hypothetical protein [Candidatus Woesearchaeota archaeon]